MGFDMGTLAVAAQAAGALATSYGTYQQKKGERYAMEAQAQVADNNKQIATWQAEDAITRGQSEVQRQGLKVAALKGTQRASLAARGLDLGEGSALDILTDTDFMGKIDANTLEDNAGKEAWAYRTQASNYGSDAAILRQGAGNINPGRSASASLLTGAGKVASSWYTLSEKGAVGGKR